MESLNCGHDNHPRRRVSALPSPSAHQETLERGLERLARRLRGPGARLRACRRLSGGASLETWSFTVQHDGGSEDLILRRRAGSSRAEVVLSLPLATEALLLRAAARGDVPVPTLIHLCDAADELGEAFVARHVGGEALGRRIAGDARFAGVRPRLAWQCGQILARVHALSVPEAVLDTEHAVAVIDRYEKLYRVSDLRRPVLELSLRHLRTVAPEPETTVLLHGDFRNGNLLVDEQQGVTAVLDWELAHRGDPAEDLGWLCVNAWRFGHPAKPVGGFGDYASLLEGYAAAGGAPMTLSRLRYWQAVGSLKWAIMCLGMYNSWASGQSGSVERAMIGRRISESEIDLINLLEAGL